MSSPERIGRYTVSRRLGSGAFALVWLGHDEVLDAPVAIKVLAENWAEQLDLRTRFVEEARVLRRADSDRVVRVFDIGDLPDGRPYFVMTYADRGSLAERLADGPLPVIAALHHGAEIARGVAVLHETGVIHRDVKPSNVLFRSTVDGGERLLIADLGLSKAMENASGFSVAAGSPGYMAPEQAVLGGGIDHRADIYGIGATVYRALTGQVPAHDNQVPPSAVRPGLPDSVDAILLRAMAADPERRWPTAQALANALQGLADRASAEGDDATVRRPHLSTVDTQGQRLRIISRAALAPPSPDTRPITPPPRPAPPPQRQPALPASPQPAPAPTTRRRRWPYVAVAAVAVAAGVTTYLVRTAAADPVTFADVTGQVQVSVPADWSGTSAGGGWSPSVLGAAVESNDPALAVSADLTRWHDENDPTPGVFVGVGRAKDLPAKAVAVTHDACAKGTTAQRDGALSGKVVRWTCPHGLSYTEAGLSTSNGRFVYVQIKQSGPPDRTAEILDSVLIH